MSDDRSAEDPAGHDAQRELEQRALRNVRGLVERIQADEQSKRGTEIWVVVGLMAAIVLIGVIVAISVARKPGSGHEIVVPPPAKAPAR
jgi:hypothetical protein